jgi:O-antigen/teichoic acid export membrane protein
MLPIYTRVLTPADYGTIELLSMVIDFASIIFGLRIGEAIFRFYLDYEEKQKKNEVISTALYLTGAFNGIGLLIIMGLSGSISSALFGGSDHRNLLILFSLSLLFQPLIEIPLTYIRVQQRPWLFMSFSSMKLILQLSLNIYLVVYGKLGVEGVILSAVISGGIMSLILTTYCLHQIGFRFSLTQAKQLISFSYPMIFASILMFYITFGDRYFLKLYGTLSDVGVYSLGYKFGFLLFFIGINPFFSIWDSEKYNVLKSPDAKANFRMVFVLFMVFVSMIVVLLSLFSKNILMVMANPEFWAAYKIVPIILVAYLFQGITDFCNMGILIEKKTFIITKSTLLSVAVITPLYIWLIPRFGGYGAAWATLISFVIRFVYVYYKSKALYDMELPWRKVFLLLPPCFSAILIGYFGPINVVQSIVINLIVVLLLFYIISMMPILPDNQRYFLQRILLQPWTFPRELHVILRKT